MRVDVLNAFDNINFLPATPTLTNFEVLTAYRDISNTQDPGGRLLQFSTRINW